MKKVILIVSLNLLAVAVPGFALAGYFGPNEAVDPQSGKHLLALLASGAVGGIFGFVSSQLAARGGVSFFDTIEIGIEGRSMGQGSTDSEA